MLHSRSLGDRANRLANLSTLSRISTGDSPTFTVSCTQREGHRKGHCANRLHHCWPLACTDASLYCLTFDLSPFLASLFLSGLSFRSQSLNSFLASLIQASLFQSLSLPFTVHSLQTAADAAEFKIAPSQHLPLAYREGDPHHSLPLSGNKVSIKHWKLLLTGLSAGAEEKMLAFWLLEPYP